MSSKQTTPTTTKAAPRVWGWARNGVIPLGTKRFFSPYDRLCSAHPPFPTVGRRRQEAPGERNLTSEMGLRAHPGQPKRLSQDGCEHRPRHMAHWVRALTPQSRQWPSAYPAGWDRPHPLSRASSAQTLPYCLSIAHPFCSFQYSSLQQLEHQGSGVARVTGAGGSRSQSPACRRQAEWPTRRVWEIAM